MPTSANRASPLPYGEQDYHRRKAMPAELDAAVVAAWRASGISTPLFRKTSCGVAYAHGSADYNGHWGVPRDSATSAPPPSSSAAPPTTASPTAADMDRVLAQLGYHTPYLIEDGHVWTHGLGEQRRYAIQHTLGSRSGNWTSRIYLHAHGRAPHGHGPDPAQAGASHRAPRPAHHRRRGIQTTNSTDREPAP